MLVCLQTFVMFSTVGRHSCIPSRVNYNSVEYVEALCSLQFFLVLSVLVALPPLW